LLRGLESQYTKQKKAAEWDTEESTSHHEKTEAEMGVDIDEI